jgi:mono/diheme cytochrome c family protein
MKRNFIIFSLVPLTVLLFSFYQSFDLEASVKRGKNIYEANCMACHMAEGEGIPGVYPPLANTDFLDDKDRLVKIALLGIRGPLEVNGVQYNGEMPGLSLSDQEVADVLNYVRNSWGNVGEAILPSEIQPALQTESGGYQPY